MLKQVTRSLHRTKFWLFALSLLLMPIAGLRAADRLVSLSPTSYTKRKPSLKKEPSHKRYDFIRYSSNRLFFPNQASGLASFHRFFEKVNSLQHHATGKVRIVHFGGSHVQADVWTGQVRRRLREWKPECEGERGFIFPQKLARSNGSPNFRVNYTGHWRAHRHTKHTAHVPVGVSGVAVSTTDSLAELEIILTGNGWLDYPYPQYVFKQVKVFHNAEDTSYIVRLADTTLHHQCFINRAAGYTAFTFDEPLSSVRLEFVRQHHLASEFVLRGLLLEHDRPGFSYSAIGVNGATVRSYLHCTLLGKELALLNPDLIVFSIGVNDTRGKYFNAKKFEEEYEQLLQVVKSAAPHAAIIFITNSDNLTRRRAPNVNTLSARDAILRLAQRHNAAVWDMFEVMGGLRSFAYWQQAKLAKRDRVHFNRDGYLLLGNLFFDALLSAYDSYRDTEFAVTKH
jgi:lysophospholipase L1-like esterase